MNTIYILLAVLSTPTLSWASIEKLPAEVRAVAETLPDNALTLPLILVRAMDKADSFKLVKSENYKIPISEMGAEAVFDTQLSLKTAKTDSENQPVNAFGYSNFKNSTSSLGISKYFSTGTALSAELAQGRTEYTAGAIHADTYETKTTLGLSQNLWKDAFGYSSRKKLKASALASTAQHYQAHEALDQWALGLIQQFYTAWYSQRQADVAYESLERRNRLLKATLARVRRGTAEAPDRLQVEAFQILAKNRVTQSQNFIEDQWRKLVLLIKLPSSWIDVDPRYIPIKLDDTQLVAASLCTNFKNKGITEESPSVLKFKTLHESALLMKDAAENEKWPMLNLFGTYVANGVDAARSESESLSFGNDYPGWTLGLELKMPLGFNSEKSKLAESFANELASQANFLNTKDTLRIDWLNRCAELDRLKSNVSENEKAYQKQTQRQKLEEARFRVGRVPVINVIQAGDDAADAALNWHQSEIDLRANSWQILSMAGKVPDALENYAKELKQFELNLNKKAK